MRCAKESVWCVYRRVCGVCIKPSIGLHYTQPHASLYTTTCITHNHMHTPKNTHTHPPTYILLPRNTHTHTHTHTVHPLPWVPPAAACHVPLVQGYCSHRVYTPMGARMLDHQQPMCVYVYVCVVLYCISAWWCLCTLFPMFVHPSYTHHHMHIRVGTNITFSPHTHTSLGIIGRVSCESIIHRASL